MITSFFRRLQQYEQLVEDGAEEEGLPSGSGGDAPVPSATSSERQTDTQRREKEQGMVKRIGKSEDPVDLDSDSLLGDAASNSSSSKAHDVVTFGLSLLSGECDAPSICFCVEASPELVSCKAAACATLDAPLDGYDSGPRANELSTSGSSSSSPALSPRSIEGYEWVPEEIEEESRRHDARGGDSHQALSSGAVVDNTYNDEDDDARCFDVRSLSSESVESVKKGSEAEGRKDETAGRGVSGMGSIASDEFEEVEPSSVSTTEESDEGDGSGEVDDDDMSQDEESSSDDSSKDEEAEAGLSDADELSEQSDEPDDDSSPPVCDVSEAIVAQATTAAAADERSTNQQHAPESDPATKVGAGRSRLVDLLDQLVAELKAGEVAMTNEESEASEVPQAGRGRAKPTFPERPWFTEEPRDTGDAIPRQRETVPLSASGSADVEGGASEGIAMPRDEQHKGEDGLSCARQGEERGYSSSPMDMLYAGEDAQSGDEANNTPKVNPAQRCLPRAGWEPEGLQKTTALSFPASSSTAFFAGPTSPSGEKKDSKENVMAAQHSCTSFGLRGIGDGDDVTGASSSPLPNSGLGFVFGCADLARVCGLRGDGDGDASLGATKDSRSRRKAKKKETEKVTLPSVALASASSSPLLAPSSPIHLPSTKGVEAMKGVELSSSPSSSTAHVVLPPIEASSNRFASLGSFHSDSSAASKAPQALGKLVGEDLKESSIARLARSIQDIQVREKRLQKQLTEGKTNLKSAKKLLQQQQMRKAGKVKLSAELQKEEQAKMKQKESEQTQMNRELVEIQRHRKELQNKLRQAKLSPEDLARAIKLQEENNARLSPPPPPKKGNLGMKKKRGKKRKRLSKRKKDREVREERRTLKEVKGQEERERWRAEKAKERVTGTPALEKENAPNPNPIESSPQSLQSPTETWRTEEEKNGCSSAVVMPSAGIGLAKGAGASSQTSNASSLKADVSVDVERLESLTEWYFLVAGVSLSPKALVSPSGPIGGPVVPQLRNLMAPCFTFVAGSPPGANGMLVVRHMVMLRAIMERTIQSLNRQERRRLDGIFLNEWKKAPYFQETFPGLAYSDVAALSRRHVLWQLLWMHIWRRDRADALLQEHASWQSFGAASTSGGTQQVPDGFLEYVRSDPSVLVCLPVLPDGSLPGDAVPSTCALIDSLTCEIGQYFEPLHERSGVGGAKTAAPPLPTVATEPAPKSSSSSSRISGAPTPTNSIWPEQVLQEAEALEAAGGFGRSNSSSAVGGERKRAEVTSSLLQQLRKNLGEKPYAWMRLLVQRALNLCICLSRIDQRMQLTVPPVATPLNVAAKPGKANASGIDAGTHLVSRNIRMLVLKSRRTAFRGLIPDQILASCAGDSEGPSSMAVDIVLTCLAPGLMWSHDDGRKSEQAKRLEPDLSGSWIVKEEVAGLRLVDLANII